MKIMISLIIPIVLVASLRGQEETTNEQDLEFPLTVSAVSSCKPQSKDDFRIIRVRIQNITEEAVKLEYGYPSSFRLMELTSRRSIQWFSKSVVRETKRESVLAPGESCYESLILWYDFSNFSKPVVTNHGDLLLRIDLNAQSYNAPISIEVDPISKEIGFDLQKWQAAYIHAEFLYLTDHLSQTYSLKKTKEDLAYIEKSFEDHALVGNVETYMKLFRALPILLDLGETIEKKKISLDRVAALEDYRRLKETLNLDPKYLPPELEFWRLYIRSYLSLFTGNIAEFESKLEKLRSLAITPISKYRLEHTLKNMPDFRKKVSALKETQ
ncbi:hypothetical protein BVX99_02525 [bacterium F16]|nr:hypothetical protein BVX99_02525 [bacterium F16]